MNLKSSTRCFKISILVERFFRHVADTLSGKSTVLAANYFPSIDLSDGDYELGLAIFKTCHTVPNVNEQ